MVWAPSLATEYTSSTTSPQRPLGRASVIPKVGPAVEVRPVCQGSTLRSDPEKHHSYSRLTRQGPTGRTGPTTSEREGQTASYRSDGPHAAALLGDLARTSARSDPFALKPKSATMPRG